MTKFTACLLVVLPMFWAGQAAAQEGNNRSSAEKTEVQKRYEKEAIYWSQDLIVATSNSQVVAARTVQKPHKGKYGPALSVAEFYDAVGEHELASDYRSDTALKWGLGAGLGGPLLIGGMVLVLTNVGGDRYDWNTGQLIERDHTAEYVGGAVMISLGFTGLMLALFLNVDPLHQGQKREMADEFNRRLRKKLSASRRADVVDLRLTPTLSHEGGGLSLSGRF